MPPTRLASTHILLVVALALSAAAVSGAGAQATPPRPRAEKVEAKAEKHAAVRKAGATRAKPTMSATAATTTLDQRAALQRDIVRLGAMDPLPSIGDTVAAPLDYVGIPVFLATRRKPVGRIDEPEGYYGGADDTLQYGVATVTIPARRRPGTADGRGWCRFRPGPLACAKTSSNSVLVGSLTRQSESEWLAQLSQKIDALTVPADVLLFVHGYNNGSADVLHRAAQLAYDAGFNGPVLAYDWASRGETALYTADEATAERSVPDFERVLRRVADSTHAQHIVIVAHSMGTRLVSYALRDLGTSAADLRIDQVIFAAADIDSATFVQQLALPVTKNSQLVTLYASSRDRALKASADIVHHAPRVGSGPPSLIIGNGVDYVDASAMDTDLIGHGYFSENKELLDDIFLILRHRMPAADRNLRRLQASTGVYYQLR
jgi:esterase/lipase superfamily enzyme